ncbi:MAG: HAD-IB family phosphatase, partial [Candidatus Bathyarchaeia archaeon]
MPKHRGLIVFDVEGVIIPKNRFLLFEVGREVGFFKLSLIIFYGLLYEAGLISIKTAIKRVAKILQGMEKERMLQIFRRIPIMPSVEKTIQELKHRGWKVAFISSGIPDFLVEDLVARLKADYAYGFRLEIRDNHATGGVSGEVLESNGKLKVLEQILRIEQLNPKNCVIVADDRNNAPIML